MIKDQYKARDVWHCEKFTQLILQNAVVTNEDALRTLKWLLITTGSNKEALTYQGQDIRPSLVCAVSALEWERWARMVNDLPVRGVNPADFMPEYLGSFEKESDDGK